MVWTQEISLLFRIGRFANEGKALEPKSQRLPVDFKDHLEGEKRIAKTVPYEGDVHQIVRNRGWRLELGTGWLVCQVKDLC